MNKVVWGLGGLVIGAISGFVAGKLVMEKKVYQRIAELEQEYKSFDEYRRVEYDDSDSDENDDRVKVESARDAIKGAKRSPDTDTDYTKYYAHRKDAVEYEDGEEPPTEDEVDLEYRAEQHAANRMRPPRIISYEEAANLADHIGWATLYFYEGNEVMTDEDDNVIDEPGLLISDCLDKYGFRNSEEPSIYVLNYAHDKCYEVVRVRGDYDGGVDEYE